MILVTDLLLNFRFYSLAIQMYCAYLLSYVHLFVTLWTVLQYLKFNMIKHENTVISFFHPPHPTPHHFLWPVVDTAHSLFFAFSVSMSCHGIYSIIQERNLERTLICLFPSTSTMWKFLWSDPSSPFLLPLCGPVHIVFHLAWFITLKSIFYSIAVLSYSAVSDSLWPHGL